MTMDPSTPGQTGDMNVTAYPIDRLRPYHRNPRRGNIAVIAESLKTLGQYRPIVVNAGTHTGRPDEVLAGNHTLLAARELGWVSIDGVTVDVDDDTAARIVLVDNRSNDLAGYDDEVLAGLLSDLPDLTATGYTDEDLEALLDDIGRDSGGIAGDHDDVPDGLAEAVSKPGDVWLLGPHRVMCGDALDPGVLDKALGGAEPGIIYTDPPYGIAIVRGGKVGGGGPVGGKGGGGKVVPASTYLPIAGDNTVDAAVDAFHLLHSAYPDALHVWWGSNHYAASAGLPDASCWLVWDKENTGNFADCELAWTNHPGAVRLFRHMWNGMLRASERTKRVHPTQKPVALAIWAFGVIDPKSERATVLDVFAGSGSTLLAAHETGRTAVLVELEPHYVDVICARWQQATGQRPRIEGGDEHDFGGG